MDIVRRLEIEHACSRLATLYCHHIDHGNAEGFVDLWTEDGVYQPAARSEPIVGRDAIRQWVRAYPAHALTRHVTANHLVEVVDEDTAVGTSYTLVFREPHPVPGEISSRMSPRSFVEYVDSYRRTPDGWRFARRVYRFLFLQEGEPTRPAPRPDFPTAVGSLPL